MRNDQRLILRIKKQNTLDSGEVIEAHAALISRSTAAAACRDVVHTALADQALSHCDRQGTLRLS